MNPGQTAVADIVKPQKGNILRNADAALLRRLDDTKSIGIRCGKNGGKIPLLGEELLGQLVAILDRGQRKGVVAVLGRQPEILTGGGVALGSELVGGAAPAAAKIQNVPVAKAAEVLHAHIRPPVVIHRDVALRHLPQVLAYEHRGQAGQIGAQLFVALRAGGNQDDAVHLPPDHQLKQLLFLLQVPGGVAQNDIVASGPGLTVDVVGQIRHEGVVYPRKNQAQQFGAFHYHGPGHRVGRIIHLLADLEDPLPGIYADLRAAGQGPGNGGVGNAGCFCNVFDGNILHKLASLAKIFRTFFRNFIVKPDAQNCKNNLGVSHHFL